MKTIPQVHFLYRVPHIERATTIRVVISFFPALADLDVGKLSPAIKKLSLQSIKSIRSRERMQGA